MVSNEPELSDKEWRQMRRQMPKLHFEPVPETPALLPRSLYGEIDDKELASIREEENSDVIRESGPKDLSSHVEVTKKDCKCSELPSTSMAVSPLIARRIQFQEQIRPPAKEFHLDDAELASIDAEMAAAHDATRRAVMRAFIELKAKKARTEAMERMKVSEAHSNDVKILQDKMEELKAQVARAEAKHEQCDLVLDRFSIFSAKQSHHNQERWSGGYSLVACFRSWKNSIRQKVETHGALRRVLLQYCKRQQCESFRHWNASTRNHLLQKQLQDQKDWYEHKIVEMAKEYQIKIQQLQQEVDDAKCQVTDAQKCCQKLEEDLRLIFLRGVSAMNIEALTAFRSSHKHRHTLGEQERSELPTREKEKSSNQTAESVKTVKIAVPEVMPSPKELPTNTTPETSVPAPVVAAEAVDVSSSLSPSKRSKVQLSYSQAPLTVKRSNNGQSRPSNTTELRSAEMIRKHELPVPNGRQSPGRLVSSTYRPYSAPSPTKQWSRPQLNAKYQVEMQYMRSEVAASAARSRPTHWKMRRQHSTEPEIGGEMHEDDNEGILNDAGEDEIDLEGYEEYLEHLKSKSAMRPCSARVVRPVPTECPQFFADNPVPTRPARPSSARPRMRTTPRNSSDDHTFNGSQSRSNGVGMRRKRQGEKIVHARIRAVYNDVGSSPVAMKRNATSALSKFKGLKESEMHDEYYRLLDAESELKAAYLQEQQKRMKAVTHVRRLEEILAMKDKKIESLLHAKTVGADRSLSTDRSVVQRDRAERDRQSHALTQKLKQKIAQQSQLLSSYEEAMQSLRSGIKSTSLMELEEERSQLYEELRHHQELLNRQRLEWEGHQQKLIAFGEAEARTKLQIAKLQQENKVVAHEKRKLEQEVGFLKSQVVLLQNNLALEQRKRTYDRDFSESVGKRTASSPTQKVMLAQALDEMRKLVRKETATSIKREKLKTTETTRFQPDLTSPAYQSSTSVSTIKKGVTAPSSSRARAQSAITTTTRPHTAVVRKTTTVPSTSQPDLEMHDTNFALMTSKHQNQKPSDDPIEIKDVQKTTEAANPPSDMETVRIFTIVRQDSHQSAENINSLVTGNSDQNASGELSEVYYQLCTAPQNSFQLTASTLELADDEDLDSASSGDLLDDAQHLKSEPGMNTSDSIDDIADAELLNFDLATNEEVRDTEAPFFLPPVVSSVEVAAQEMLQNDGGQSPETFDDLYAPDFLDTDT